MKTGYHRHMRTWRYAAIVAFAGYTIYACSQLPAFGAAGDGPSNREGGCGQCHGSAGGQAYVVIGGQLFPTGPIMPNGPTGSSASFHDAPATSGGNFGGVPSGFRM